MTAISENITTDNDTEPTETKQNRHRYWLSVGAVGVAAALAAIVYALWHDWPFWAIDFEDYRLGANTVLDGGPLYEVRTAGANLLYNYTPISAILFIPVVVLPYSLMTAVWVGFELLWLQLVVWMTLDAVGMRRTGHRVVATVLITTAAVFLSAVDNDLSLGQINILLMFLVLLDLLRGEGRRWQGVWIGLAAGIKLIPLIYVVYLALTGRGRAARNALGVFAATVAVGFALLPSDAAFYWSTSGTGANPDRVGEPDNLFNQSLRGLVARVTENGASFSVLWLVLAAVVGAAGVAAAAVLHRRGERLRGILVCALTALLVSPVSWEHHWVWAVPLLLMIAGEAWRRRSAGWATLFVVAAAVFYTRLLDLAMPKATEADASLDEVRKETADKLVSETSVVDTLLPNSIVLAGIVFWCVLAYPAIRRRRGLSGACGANVLPLPALPARVEHPATQQ